MLLHCDIDFVGNFNWNVFLAIRPSARNIYICIRSIIIVHWMLILDFPSIHRLLFLSIYHSILADGGVFSCRFIFIMFSSKHCLDDRYQKINALDLMQIDNHLISKKKRQSRKRTNKWSHKSANRFQSNFNWQPTVTKRFCISSSNVIGNGNGGKNEQVNAVGGKQQTRNELLRDFFL